MRLQELVDLSSDDRQIETQDQGKECTKTVNKIDLAEKAIYKSIMTSEVNAYVKEVQKFKSDMQKVCGAIHEHLDETVQALVSNDAGYKDVQESCNPIRLIKSLRAVCRNGKGEE